MSNPTASTTSRSIGGRARRGRWMLMFGLAVGLAVGWTRGVYVGRAQSAFEDPRSWAAPTHMLTTGRVEGPPGVTWAGLRVVASRHGRPLGQTELDGQGGFRMNLRGNGPFDLHVTDWLAWRDPYASDPPEAVPESAMEGGLHGLAWGARRVLVRVAPVPLASVSILVRGPDGAPVSGETVRLRSMTNEVREPTGTDGVARFTDIPVRSWRAVASVHGGGGSALATGWRDFVPEGQVVEVAVPVGIRMFVRLAAPASGDVVLSCEVPHLIEVYQTISWRPGPDGRMPIFVAPDCRSLSLDATKRTRLDERTTKERTVAAGAMAVAEDAELVLEPLEAPER